MEHGAVTSLIHRLRPVNQVGFKRILKHSSHAALFKRAETLQIVIDVTVKIT